MTSKMRNRKAATIAETAAGLFIIIPVFLLLADVVAVLVAQTQNDSLAKQAARAASEQDNQPDPNEASNAAQQVISSYGSNSLVSNPTIVMFRYNQAPAPAGSLYVQTRVTCNLPAPIPGFGSTVNLNAEATETIVALPP